MIEVVIIGHNEGKFADDIIGSLPTELTIHYVADRCTDDTVERLSKYSNVDIIDTTDMQLEGRQTSFCRNLGLSKCNPESDVLFIDGDRYVAEGDIVTEISSIDSDIILFKLTEDQRTNERIHECYGTFYNGFYSCGIFIKRKVIDAVTDFQNGELFLTELQSDWGVEDTYLGDVCYHLGFNATLSENIRLNGCFDRSEVPRASMLRRLTKRKLLTTKT